MRDREGIESRRLALEFLNAAGNERRPARLMTGAQAFTRLCMKILIEERVSPVRVVAAARC